MSTLTKRWPPTPQACAASEPLNRLGAPVTGAPRHYLSYGSDTGTVAATPQGCRHDTAAGAVLHAAGRRAGLRQRHRQDVEVRTGTRRERRLHRSVPRNLAAGADVLALFCASPVGSPVGTHVRRRPGA